MEEKELTILLPVLNEEKTIKICIDKANKFIKENKINAEVLVADNNSMDNSCNIAKELGARVIHIDKIGYGNAIREGIKNAKGKYVIMGDADDSYNFLELHKFIEKLREGNELVIGNRYKSNMEKGSMKVLHKYIGTPILSYIISKKFDVNIGDCNCGLRGLNKEKINKIGCIAEGMEYATEQIIKARKNNLKMIQIPINFYKDARGKKSHLKPIKDGIRHLKIIIKESRKSVLQ